MAKLTPKQQRFVEEYLVDLNATQAAIRSGYSKKTAASIGDENLRKPEIASAIRKAKETRSKRTQVNQDYVLEVIVDTIERCRQTRPVLDKDGKPVMVQTPTGQLAAAYTFEPMAVLKGADLLARHTGLYELDNRQQRSGIHGLMEFLQGLPDPKPCHMLSPPSP